MRAWIYTGYTQHIHPRACGSLSDAEPFAVVARVLLGEGADSRAAVTHPLSAKDHTHRPCPYALSSNKLFISYANIIKNIMTSWNIHILIKIIEGKRYDVALEIETQLFLPSLSSKKKVIF